MTGQEKGWKRELFLAMTKRDTNLVKTLLDLNRAETDCNEWRIK